MPDGLLEIESLSPGPYQATRKIGWGLMEGRVSQAWSLSPLWTLSPRRESTPSGCWQPQWVCYLFSSKAPTAHFRLCPGARGLGGSYPACRTMAILSDP